MDQLPIKRYYVDGHVHIGRSSNGSPIKMAASSKLTLDSVIKAARYQKGLDLIGLIDAAAVPILDDIQQMILESRLIEVAGGGFLATAENILLMPGAEVEIQGPEGCAAHFGAFVGSLAALEELSQWLTFRQKNSTLSSQRTRASANDLGEFVRELDGILIINHAFTPHKGLYGNCVHHMSEMIADEYVTAVELGLSADTNMADRLSELSRFSFVTNSDAHSVTKMGREYHVVELPEMNFTAYREALQYPERRQMVFNVGLWPEMGKYHLSFCPKCGQHWDQAISYCPYCKETRIIQGVWNRLQFIADRDASVSPDFRPPYLHQIPLEWIPGLGSKKMDLLFREFGSEMNILNKVDTEDLIKVVGEPLAREIDKARRGQLEFIPGAGGFYGQLRNS